MQENVNLYNYFKVYPNLSRHLVIDRPNQVWATDITCIPVQGRYFYLVAVIELYSRYVLNRSLRNSMTSRWCRQTLDEAVQQFGKPEIVNTDQGSQFYGRRIFAVCGQ